MGIQSEYVLIPILLFLLFQTTVNHGIWYCYQHQYDRTVIQINVRNNSDWSRDERASRSAGTVYPMPESSCPTTLREGGSAGHLEKRAIFHTQQADHIVTSKSTATLSATASKTIFATTSAMLHILWNKQPRVHWNKQQQHRKRKATNVEIDVVRDLSVKNTKQNYRLCVQKFPRANTALILEVAQLPTCNYH